MCWVMPPASPATTLAERMRSSSSVLPWSTWPMTVMTGGRGSLGVRIVVVVVVEQGLQLQLLLLARLDEEHVGADLEGEQLDLLVGERHRGRDHLAVLQEEAHDVGRGAVQLGAVLLRRGAPLDDDGALGDRGIRRRVGRHRLRRQLLHRATTPRDLPARGARRCEPSRTATGTAGTTRRAAGTSTGPAGTAGTGHRSRHRARPGPPPGHGPPMPGRDRRDRRGGRRRDRRGGPRSEPPGRARRPARAGRRRDRLAGQRERAAGGRRDRLARRRHRARRRRARRRTVGAGAGGGGAGRARAGGGLAGRRCTGRGRPGGGVTGRVPGGGGAEPAVRAAGAAGAGGRGSCSQACGC